MGSLPEEVLRVLFLDAARQLITDEQLQQGSLAQLILYPRIIFKRALELDAASIVLVHNHPSGDPTPSEADISSTEKLAALACSLGIELAEHIVVSRSGYALIGQRPNGRGLIGTLKHHLLRDSGRSPVLPDCDLALTNAKRTARRRLLRRQIVGSKKYLGEPAWDMLIDLFIQHCEEKKTSTGDLCVSSELPLSTALRLVQRMCDDGLIHKVADTSDGRRQIVELDPDLAWRLLAYFGTPTEG
jgi:DNA repair protein RadC